MQREGGQRETKAMAMADKQRATREGKEEEDEGGGGVGGGVSMCWLSRGELEACETTEKGSSNPNPARRPSPSPGRRQLPLDRHAKHTRHRQTSRNTVPTLTL